MLNHSEHQVCLVHLLREYKIAHNLSLEPILFSIVEQF